MNFIQALFVIILSALFIQGFAQNCSQEELEYLAANADLIQSVSSDCAFDCVLAGNQNQCILNCLAAELDVSEECLQCNATQVACVLDNCAFACLFPNSPACLNCIDSNCMPAYFACIGDNDMDGFTVEGGDCDDFDPSINPNAIEIEGDGIDQNCDGDDFLTGILESASPNGFLIYALGDGNLRMSIRESGTVSIYNSTGKILIESRLQPGITDLSLGQRGLIIYRFRTDEYRLSGKIINP